MGGRGLLCYARLLIEQGWTKGADARAADDSIVRPWDARAASWSLLGALVAAVEQVAATKGEASALRDLAHSCILLADTLDTDSLERWNDGSERTRHDVLAALDHAATLTAGEEDDVAGFPPN